VKIIPVFLPYAGCKRRCVFCDQISATGVKRIPTLEELDSLVREYEKTGKGYELAFYGGTFTGLPEDKQKEYLKWAQKWINEGVVESIRISTRPDEIDEEKLLFLKDNCVKIVEIGVQSFFDDVLEASKREYTAEDALKACHLVKKMGLVLGIHLMIGLPKDSRAKDIVSALKCVEVRADLVRIHPALVFKGAELFRMMEKGLYTPMDLEEALDITSDMVIILEGHGVKVIRLGYYVPQERIHTVMGGPYHPSFGDMVRARVVRKVIEYFEPESLMVPQRYISWFFSYGNKNLVEGKLQEGTDEIVFLKKGRQLTFREVLKIVSGVILSQVT